MSGGIPQCNLSGINYSELFIDYLCGKNINEKLKKQNFNIKVGSKRKYIKLD
jgi:preprotein translocase subunit SecB